MAERQLVNEIEAVGRVLAIRTNDMGFDTIRLQIREGVQSSIDFVSVSGRHRISRGDYVKVKAYIHGTRRYDGSRGRSTLIQTYMITDVEPATSLLEEKFGVAGRGSTTNYFRGYFAGEITAVITDNTRWVRIYVTVQNQEKQNDAVTVCLNYRTSAIMPNFEFKRGDFICVYASVSHNEKDLDGGVIHFQNLNVEDIIRLDENGQPLKEDLDKWSSPRQRDDRTARRIANAIRQDRESGTLLEAPAGEMSMETAAVEEPAPDKAIGAEEPDSEEAKKRVEAIWETI